MAGGQWVVVLEADARAPQPIDEAGLQRLLGVLSAMRPVALHSPIRYALQVQLEASSHGEALDGAMARWWGALAHLGLPRPRLIRAEVLTLQEFDAECGPAYGNGTPGSSPSTGPHGEHAEDADGGESAAGRLGDRLLWEVFHDPLTGFPARALFVNQLEQFLARPVDQDRTVLVLKLTSLRTVNEQWGHAAGDELLVTAAERLRMALPADLPAARVGGNEFAVLVHRRSEGTAARLAEELLATLDRPMRLEGAEVTAATRVGMAVTRLGQQAEQLLDDATAAAHAAAHGPRPVEVHRAGLDPTSPRPAGAGVVGDPLGYLMVLQRAALAANESSSLEHAARLVINQVCARLCWSVGHLYVTAADGRLAPARLSPPEQSHYQGLLDFLDELFLDPGEGLAGRVLATGRPAWTNGIRSGAIEPWTSIARECGLDAALAFPVLVGREVVGVLEFFAEAAPQPDDALVDVLRAVGGQLGRIVERRRGETRLLASEDRLRQAQSMAQLGTWHVDVPRGRCTWSGEMCDILGIPHDTEPGMDAFLALVHPEDRERVGGAIKEACEAGRAGPFEFRVIRPDGALRWACARINSSRDDAGVMLTAYGTMFDVTHVKSHDEELRERQRQLTLAERVAGIGSWTRDIATNRLEWSDGLYWLWRARPGSFEPTIEGLTEAIHPGDRERMERLMTQAVETNGYAADFRAIAHDGRLRWFRGRATLERAPDGGPVRLLGTVQDVTREKQAEEELRASETRYRRIMETLQRLH